LRNQRFSLGIESPTARSRPELSRKKREKGWT
jgi:hypothetical protein